MAASPADIAAAIAAVQARAEAEGNDGTKIAFPAVGDSGEGRLYIRAVDEAEPRPIEGSLNGAYPFWSPDSAQLAFFVEEKLKRVTSAGVAPQTICDAPGSRGGWGAPASGRPAGRSLPRGAAARRADGSA